MNTKNSFSKVVKLASNAVTNKWKKSVLFSTTVLLASMAQPAWADPPSDANFQVFCFRITDIQAVEGDPENDQFIFEFEVLNWTDQPADDLHLNEVASRGTPFIDDAGVDSNGRPIGPGSDRPPGNQDIPNDWNVTEQTPTVVTWEGGTAIPNIDLLGIGAENRTPQETIDAVNAMYPSFEPDFNPPLAGQGQDIDPGMAETVDNGPNVLDGFTLTIDDFKPGDAIAYEWNLTNGGNPIDNNAFGFGVLSLTRSFEGFSGASEGFSTFPDPLFPFNTGFRQSQLEFFDTVYQVSDTTQFAVEMAGGVSVPEPSSLTALALTGMGMIGYGKKRRK